MLKYINEWGEIINYYSLLRNILHNIFSIDTYIDFLNSIPIYIYIPYTDVKIYNILCII